MTAKSNFRGILSLSAASMALLQSVAVTKAAAVEIFGPHVGAPDGQIINAKTHKLILTPPHQEELLRLYAFHSSHASHSSHSSHVSGMGYGSHYSAATYVPPSTPYSPPAVASKQPAPKSLPPPAIHSDTNAPTQTNATNKVTKPNPSGTNSTNAASVRNSETDAANIASLTKQAAKGSADAQYSLGIDYLYGFHGLKRNVDKAQILLELAATQGNAFAKERLAELKGHIEQFTPTAKH